MKRKIKNLTFLLALGFSVLIFQNCGEGFRTKSVQDLLSVVPSNNPPTSPTPIINDEWIIDPSPVFTKGSSATYNLNDTLPVGAVRGGTFTVDPNGSPLPSGMVLNPNGTLSPGTADVSDVSNVIFIYSEP